MPIWSTISTFASLNPYHLIVFSSLLGSSYYQTFVVTKVSFHALPRSAFTTLQKKIFPTYFQIQFLLIILSAATYPPFSFISLAGKPGDLVPFVVAGITSALNLAIYEPRTRQAMIQRTHQETIDGRKHDDESVSEEMIAKKRGFSRQHAMCIHINLLSIAAITWYAFRLSARISVS